MSECVCLGVIRDRWENNIMEVCKLGVMKNKLFDPIEMWGGMNC